MSNNATAKVVALKEDRKGGYLVIYCQYSDGRLGRVKTQEALAEVERDLAGNLDPKRYLRGDPIAEPYNLFVTASDISQQFYEEDIATVEGQEQVPEYLKGLEENRVELLRRKSLLQQLQFKFEAGVLTQDDPGLLAILSMDHSMVCTND